MGEARSEGQGEAALRDRPGRRRANGHGRALGQMEIPKGRGNPELHGYHLRADKLLGELHDRMPVILSESEWSKWLGEEPASEDELLAILKPCAGEMLKVWPVSKEVGNVKNNGAKLLMPA